MHILHNQHEYGPINSTIDLLKHCKKRVKLCSWENYHRQEYQTKGLLVERQNTQAVSTLLQLAQAYALSNRTTRLNSIIEHASTHIVGIT